MSSCNHLYAKVEECAFSMDTTDFFGSVFGFDGLQMDTPKIPVIHDWSTPRNARDVQSFLGFADFYRRFFASYPGITVPSLGLRARTPRGSGRCNVRTPFNSSKRPLLRHPSSTISTRPFLQWSGHTPLITPSPVFSRYALRTVKFIPSRSSVAPYLVPSSTTTLTIRSCSPSSKLSRPGDIIPCLLPYDRRDHGPQESGVLLFGKDAYASSSSLVGIALRL